MFVPLGKQVQEIKFDLKFYLILSANLSTQFLATIMNICMTLTIL